MVRGTGLDVPNCYGELPLIGNDPMCPNPRYFEHVDWIVDRTAHYGLRVAMLPTWDLSMIGRFAVIGDESGTSTQYISAGRRKRPEFHPLSNQLRAQPTITPRKSTSVWRVKAQPVDDEDPSFLKRWYPLLLLWESMYCRIL